MNPESFLKLKAMPVFAEFTDSELAAFVELLDTVTVKGGDSIVRQDELGDAMFIIVDGSVLVVHRHDGRDFELAQLGPGNFFGELALIDQLPRSADVEAITDCTLLSLKTDAITSLASIYPTAAFKLLLAVGGILVQRLRARNCKYIDSLLANTASPAE